MTAPSLSPKPDSEEQARRARLAVEALFATPAPTPSDRSTAQVIVKHRRRLEIDRSVPAPEEHLDDRPAERAPRTHLLSDPPSQVIDRLEAPQDLPPVSEDRPPRRRRMRRDLNGEVTIIRPAAEDSRPSSDVQDRSAKRGPHQQTWLDSEHGPTSLRYPRLLAQIRELESEALALQQRESAVRWIVQAMRRYELTAAEVGF